MKNELFIPTKLLTRINSLIQKEVPFNLADAEFTVRFYNKLELITANQKKVLLQDTVEMYLYIQTNSVDEETFTNISRSRLKRFDRVFMVKGKRIRFTYKDFINLLFEVNVLIINGSYSEGRFTKSYKINPNFIYNELTKVEVNIKKIFNEYVRSKEDWIKEYPHLKKQIENSYNTTVDIEKLYAYMILNIGMELSPTFNKKSGKVNNRTLTYNRIERYVNQVTKFNLNYIWFKESKEGRLYSSYTNLPSICNNFYLYKGIPLVEADITNAQPTFLSAHTNNEKFDNAVRKGIFYDLIAEELNKPRNEVKILTYKYIFFGNNQLKSGKIYNAIEKLFPGFIEEVNNLKKETELYKLLQGIESDVFIKSNVKEEKYHLTKHDAIFCLEEDLKYFKDKLTNICLDKNMEISFN